MRPAALSRRTGVFNRYWLGADLGQACFAQLSSYGRDEPRRFHTVPRRSRGNNSMRSAFQDRVIGPDNLSG